MTRFLTLFPLLLFALLVGGVTPARAQSGETGLTPGASRSSVLCLPGIYLDDPVDCTPAGPSDYLTGMARRGLVLPLAPLPASRPDPALAETGFRYGLVRTANAPVYGSLDDALQNRKKNAIYTISSGFTYISYLAEHYVDDKRFYEVEPGAFMTANDVIRIGAIPRMQGLIFSRTPSHAFGWVMSYLHPGPGPLETKRTPGTAQADYTGHVLTELEVVPVYATETVGEEEWYMVGPDEWVPGKVIARVLPNPTPPEGVTNDRWIEVNLYEQTLAVYDQRRLVFATLVATGLEPLWTRPGLFQVYQKLDTTPMRGAGDDGTSLAYYLEDVPFTMYFDKARAIHGAYWRTKLGFAQSHGCVNLTIGDAHWLFNWAQDGEWVYVWDPSGKTPTDPSFYGEGGA